MTETLPVKAVQPSGAVLEQVVIGGDLSKLTPEQRVIYYRKTCESLGLNWLTKPFDYITLNGKITLYAKRDSTDQLRKIHGVKVAIVGRERMDDVYVVTAHAELPNGRSDESIGAVNIGGLKGDGLANALMKAETKAKRRVTLSIVGLGWLDETEVDSIAEARPLSVDVETGEIASPAQQPAPTETKPTVTFAQWQPGNQKSFWARMNELGLTHETVHAEFGVDSMNDWPHSTAETRVLVDVLVYAIALGIGITGLHEALDVARVADWGRSLPEAKAAIDAWVGEQSAGKDAAR